MEVKFDIEDKSIVGFHDSAITTTTECALEYTKEIIKEAQRIGSTQNVTGTQAEITAATVTLAATILKLNPRKKRSVFKIVCQILSPISIAVVGMLWDPHLITSGDVLRIILFMVFFTLAVCSTVLIYLGKED